MGRAAALSAGMLSDKQKNPETKRFRDFCCIENTISAWRTAVRDVQP